MRFLKLCVQLNLMFRLIKMALILFSTVVGVIGGLQVFDQPYVMTRGGPGDASRTVVMTLYESAFNIDQG